MKFNKLNSFQKNAKGFSLIELMVVIVIIGILASIVAPNVLGNKAKADKQKAITDIVALENALDMYKLDNNSYPSTDQGLDALREMPDSDRELRNYRDGGYIKHLPEDPWGNPYQYIYPGEHGDVDVFTLGADGEEGGEDENIDIGNWNMQDVR